jgi:hypothetical protein
MTQKKRTQRLSDAHSRFPFQVPAKERDMSRLPDKQATKRASQEKSFAGDGGRAFCYGA